MDVVREVSDLETSACFTGKISDSQCPPVQKGACAPFSRHEVAEMVLSKPFQARMSFINALAVLLLNLRALDFFFHFSRRKKELAEKWLSIGVLPFSFIKMTVTFAV